MFVVTSDSHDDAFENQSRNERVRDTIDEIHRIADIQWPEELGGDPIGESRGVLLPGGAIEDAAQDAAEGGGTRAGRPGFDVDTLMRLRGVL